MKVEQLRAVVVAISNDENDWNSFDAGSANWSGTAILLDHASALISLAEACKRWQHARSYGDSERAANEVTAALEKLEAVK